MISAAGRLHLERQLLCAYAASEFEIGDLQAAPAAHVDFDDFVSGAEGFFATRAKQAVTVGSPFVAQATDAKLQEFTTTIRITGARRGAIYVTASRGLLTVLLMRLGATEISSVAMTAALRELAEAMVAAARSNLSNELLIWSPTVAGIETRIDPTLQTRPVIVPIHWRKYTLQVAMCIE